MDDGAHVAVVTGAAGGIGYAITRSLAESGMAVAMLDLDAKALEATAYKLAKEGLNVLGTVADISCADSVKEAVANISRTLGAPDVLVNNAGVAPGTPLEAVSESEWDHVMAVNVKGAFLLSQAVIRAMRQRRFGRIINISSMAGVMGSENAGVHYCASKAALIGMTKYLSKRYMRDGITTNAIAPGPIATEMVNELGGETMRVMLQCMPQGQLGSPADIACIAAFLASEDAGFITGAVIEASGGQTII